MDNSQQPQSSKFYLSGGVILIAAALTVAYFHFARNQKVEAIRGQQTAIAERGPRIEVVTAEQGPSQRPIKLLGDARAIMTTTLYGKVSGYIRAIPVNPGDRVTEGQTIAQIEASELDEQYAGAMADLANKRRNLARARSLFQNGSTTEVARLQAETDATMAENNTAAMATTMGYQTVIAPYSGHVIARFVDVGAFITSAATTFTSASPIVTISDDSKVKVFIYLEQADAPFVHVGDTAEIAYIDDPKRTRLAAVTRINGELDAKSRTLLAEINVENADGFLVPGSVVNVILHVPAKSYPQIPVTALLFRDDHNVVAVLDNDVVHFKAVKVASTDGAIVNIAEGLQRDEKVAINVPDEVIDGGRLQPIMLSPASRQAAAPN